MPLIVAALVLVAVLALSVLLLPLSLIQRYRLGTRRRAARAWVTALNLAGVTLSSALFLVSAALISPWFPGAFTYAASGLLAGCLLGVAGLLLTRWESTAGGLHYTPHWVLILFLKLIINGRPSWSTQSPTARPPVPRFSGTTSSTGRGCVAGYGGIRRCVA